MTHELSAIHTNFIVQMPLTGFREDEYLAFNSCYVFCRRLTRAGRPEPRLSWSLTNFGSH
jgi:hypothetical protein